MTRNSDRFLFALLVVSIPAGTTLGSGAPALTIYNQNFAVVRDTVPLELKPGTNQVRFAGATAYLEPSSVVLRDPRGDHRFQILEQNYRGDPVSQQTLLELNEGKTIEFEISTTDAGQTKRERVPGKIIRAGVGVARPEPYGYYYDSTAPIIEMNGQLRFGLPGQPLFPGLTDESILKPTLVWMIEAAQASRFDAELSYVTGELRWEADYNLVLPERGQSLDLTGWVTIDNGSGKAFRDARIKLMAGDVSKIQPRKAAAFGGFGGGGVAPQPPAVSEKSFDEYHLYTLERPTTLLDRQKKQVEFVHAAGVQSAVRYVYDGASADEDQAWAPPQEVNTSPEYGTQGNKKVWVYREFTNSLANQLGLPLPRGRVRFYRRNTDGQMEFIGENTIKHTPRDERVRLFTGNAFDLVGERKRTNLRMNFSGAAPTAVDPHTGLPVPAASPPVPAPCIDESFEITLRNHKEEAVEIRVVEHLYRWVNWKITENSALFEKTDAQTIEFRLKLPPNEQQKVLYTVHYWW